MQDTKTPKKKKGDHCIIRNGKLFCSHCGQSQDLPMPMRTEMFAAMGKTFTKMHKNCEPTWKEPEADLEQSVTARAHWWIANGEIGMSSKAIWSMMMTGSAPSTLIHYPHDPDDFSRCYKLLQRLHCMLTTDYPENYNSGTGTLEIPYLTNWDRGARLELRKNGRRGIEEDRTPVIFYRDLVDTVAYQAPNGREFYTFGWCSEREMAFSAAAWMMGYEPAIIVQGGHAFTLVTINGTLFKVDNTYGRFEAWDYGYIPVPESKLELWYNRKAKEQSAVLKSIAVAEKSWKRIYEKVQVHQHSAGR